MLLFLLKYGLFVVNIILLTFTIRYYNKYHKLSSTLLIIVLLSSLFQNLEFILHSNETKQIVREASNISNILFSFSFLIGIIQAGTLSVKYMYLPIVRKSAWIISFLIIFLGFFIIQTNYLPYYLDNIKTYIVDIITVTLNLIVGIFAVVSKKQYILLAGSLSYFFILLISYTVKDLDFVFSTAQIVFIIFLIINEKYSILRSKNKLFSPDF